ncbi:MAG: Oligopeptide transport ATP-binding protein OppD [Firmicutes bacterium]|nr:Oligopeptide transport ATP-binding protein OppD [candidate division NPL-UPA2 bacterium]MBT9155029.1 Oligopeptide transport ATP-binding protein OppD [candidate division NPL-UPA2 bacterium]MBT9156365.1 Oligopeptide transport ATP-binding protein OppD [candidate division NPL-UPA2 bacterium]
MRLLEVNNLRTSFRDKDGHYIPAVDGITFHVDQGETLGIVGESGCGKSVTMMSVMRLLDIPPARVEAESIKLLGQDLLSQSEKAMQGIRGNLMSMIFQEPMTSLNPVFTIGDQIAETLELHQKLRKPAALARAIDLLRKVGIPSAERRALDYPHQLSGGMRQRVMIAMALACTPKLLIADEPTTALDVTIQAQILDLIRDLRQELGMSIVLITHDLGVVAETADRVVVMYAGKIVEEASALDLFERPKHPYTEGLLHSIPRLDRRSDRLHVIKGVVPHPMHMPLGCRFNPRCPYAQERCYTESPLEVNIGDGHRVSCWYPLSDRNTGEVSA